MNNAVSALVDHGVHEDGNSVNTSLFQEERNCVDEVISLANNLNTNSRIEPCNQENQTETIPNTPLVIVEHEEEEKKNKKARYSMQSSSTESGNMFIYRRKINERHEILAEELSKADHGRCRKDTTNPTGKSYYSRSEVENCPAKRHVEKSSKDSTKVIVTYRGQHNHPPPKQHIPMVHRRPNAAAPQGDPSSYSSTSTLL
ncbi:hypothetical protein R3W88_009006 [Solanum pinnatisectum]|uniref:WRKY domain-containing protein n=1 Tax=Solanum pinnatisectum TaxID=50273 RepID=A0AAV9MCH4_9SOLN|nr:hypothetical protein R3W88_009006 [Solanum pinnatisectum]